MNRRTFLSQATALPLAATSAWAQQSGAEPPPNIVFFLFDKCRRDAIGSYGLRECHTPNLDYLADTGTRFDAAYVPQALCGPCRASILTGSYPHLHGLRKNVYEAHPGSSYSTYQDVIPDPFRDSRFKLWDNFPHFLNASGYATGHIGKWHLAPANPGYFDYWKGFNSLLLHWIGEPHKSRFRPDVHTDQGIRFIERHRGEPFFLYQSYYSPHEPNDPPKRFLRTLPRARPRRLLRLGIRAGLERRARSRHASLERPGRQDADYLHHRARAFLDQPSGSKRVCVPPMRRPRASR